MFHFKLDLLVRRIPLRITWKCSFNLDTWFSSHLLFPLLLCVLCWITSLRSEVMHSSCAPTYEDHSVKELKTLELGRYNNNLENSMNCLFTAHLKTTTMFYHSRKEPFVLASFESDHVSWEKLQYSLISREWRPIWETENSNFQL